MRPESERASAEVAAQLREALQAARLAPSAHNSQPWRFRVRGGQVELGWDADRRLPHGDPSGAYLHVGLGAAAEALVLAMAVRGWVAEVEAEREPDAARVATLRFAPGAAKPEDRQLARYLHERQTTRLPYAPRPVPAASLAALTAEAERGGCRLGFAEGPQQVGRVAELVAEGTARNLADPRVFAEFAGWLRRPGDPRPDGLPLDTLGFRGLDRLSAPLVLRPGVMHRLARVGLHRMAARTQARLARATPAFGLLWTPAREPADLFAGGRTMLRVWLRATALGLCVHPMTAAMDYPDTRAALSTACSCEVDGKSTQLLCFRLGYGPAGSRSARLPIAQIMHE